MPSLPSTASVFGRLTGRKQVAELEGTERPTTEIPPPALGKGNAHRRGSSVLSLTEVKRSVSLRSHRSQPSASSPAFAHKSRSSSSASPFNPTLPASPIEDDGGGGGGGGDQQQHPFFTTSANTTSSHSSRSRGKPSFSARSLSSKLSSPSLSTYSAPDPSEGATQQRPTTAMEVRRVPSTPMLPTLSMPRRTAAPPVPPPAPPPGFVGENGTQHGLYLQGTATPVPHHASGHDPKVVYKQIHEVSAKRMATIEYLRRVHDGNIFYFSTIHYSPTSLQSIPSMHPLKLGRRATNYFVLGYSLPALLDLNSGSPLEYLRALTALLQEFETYQTLMGVDSSGNSLSRGRVGNMFKIGTRGKPSRRTSTATDSVSLPASDLLNLPRSGGGGVGGSGSEALSPLETSPSPVSPVGHDFQHLVTPHLPFDPDFATVHATLCDTLIDTYAKLMDLVPAPDVCTPAVGDAFAKVDKTIRKLLVSNVMREFEESTRANVKAEVAGLGKLVLGGLM